jgi:hypothetical protein
MTYDNWCVWCDGPAMASRASGSLETRVGHAEREYRDGMAQCVIARMEVAGCEDRWRSCWVGLSEFWRIQLRRMVTWTRMVMCTG